MRIIWRKILFDITINIGSYKVEMTINQVIYFMEIIFVKLRGEDTDDHS